MIERCVLSRRFNREECEFIREYDCLILNFLHKLDCGSLLSAYSLQKLLSSFGYKSAHINDKSESCKKFYNNIFFEEFIRKYMKLTFPCYDIEDFERLNDIADTFIVSSDQSFRYSYIRKDLDKFLLNFVKYDKKKLAIAASFATDSFSADLNEINRVKELLRRFDGISIQERSGCDFCENILEVKCEYMLDPVFLCDRNYFEIFISSDYEKDYRNKVVRYFTHCNDVNRIERKVSKRMFYEECVDIYDNNISLQRFLNAIRYGKLIITNSFYGVCFAILFNKPFICIENLEDRSFVKVVSLLKEFNILERIVKPEELLSRRLNSIDWGYVNRIIESKKRNSLNWIELKLESKNVKTQKIYILETLFKKGSNRIEFKRQSVIPNIIEFLTLKLSQLNSLCSFVVSSCMSFFRGL